MKNYSLIILIFLLLITDAVFSMTSWPIFLAPDIKLLLSLNYIDASSCSLGQGKLVDKASINISTYLCKNFCPKSWSWVTISDNECHDLSIDFDWQSNEIIHIDGNDGTVSYSQITINYGRKKYTTSGNKIVFTSTPKDHWYCIEITGLNSFTCANDI